jgi:hypothetical protein
MGWALPLMNYHIYVKEHIHIYILKNNYKTNTNISTTQLKIKNIVIASSHPATVCPGW